MTVGRSSFSGRAPENWSASWEIATRRVARVAAIPGGARCRSALAPGLPVATCMVRALADIISVTREDFISIVLSHND